MSSTPPNKILCVYAAVLDKTGITPKYEVKRCFRTPDRDSDLYKFHGIFASRTDALDYVKYLGLKSFAVPDAEPFGKALWEILPLQSEQFLLPEGKP